MHEEKVVLDTNVLVSATFWYGDSYKIMKLIEENKLKLIISNFAIQKYKRILSSEEILEKQQKKKLQINKIVEGLLQESTIVIPKTIPKVVEEDPDDDNIIATAIEGKANFIVTQDNHLLKLKKYKNIEIIHPKDFINQL